MKSKNKETLQSFIDFCEEHPEYRFWQALRNWAGASYVILARFQDQKSGCWAGEDTFYRQGKDE